MRIPEPLRNNPFRFSRRRSLHSKLYDEDRSRPIRPIDSIPQYHRTPGRVSPKDYMSGFPEQYVSHPGFMQMPKGDYEPYDELQAMSMSDFGRTADEFRFAAMELAGVRSPDVDIEYDNCLMTEELFQQQIESLREQFPPDFDTNEIASQILAAQSQDDGFDMDPNLRENMLDIQMAVEQAKAESLTALNPEPMDIGPAIPQDFFEQAEQMLEEQFYEMQPAEFDYGVQMEADFSTQETMFEQPIEEMEPMADSSPQTLENIIEAEQMRYEIGMPDDMSGMQVLMNEGPIEQMYDTPEQMEPYPEPLQDGYGMMPQEMYGEQMPDEMMDPFMRPDMMDPYMMPGPLGPMGFGPGGGPQ